MKENIIMAEEMDEERFEDVLNKSGIGSLIEKLPKKYDTQVNKMIDDDVSFYPAERSKSLR